jgi:hypothetical protein
MQTNAPQQAEFPAVTDSQRSQWPGFMAVVLF